MIVNVVVFVFTLAAVFASSVVPMQQAKKPPVRVWKTKTNTKLNRFNSIFLKCFNHKPNWTILTLVRIHNHGTIILGWGVILMGVNIRSQINYLGEEYNFLSSKSESGWLFWSLKKTLKQQMTCSVGGSIPIVWGKIPPWN